MGAPSKPCRNRTTDRCGSGSVSTSFRTSSSPSSVMCESSCACRRTTQCPPVERPCRSASAAAPTPWDGRVQPPLRRRLPRGHAASTNSPPSWRRPSRYVDATWCDSCRRTGIPRRRIGVSTSMPAWRTWCPDSDRSDGSPRRVRCSQPRQDRPDLSFLVHAVWPWTTPWAERGSTPEQLPADPRQ